MTRGKASGSLSFQLNPRSKKFKVNYKASVPIPDPNTISGDRDLLEYETSIREILQRVIEAQLIQAVE
jgi:hypothetical protein